MVRSLPKRLLGGMLLLAGLCAAPTAMAINGSGTWTITSSTGSSASGTYTTADGQTGDFTITRNSPWTGYQGNSVFTGGAGIQIRNPDCNATSTPVCTTSGGDQFSYTLTITPTDPTQRFVIEVVQGGAVSNTTGNSEPARVTLTYSHPTLATTAVLAANPEVDLHPTNGTTIDNGSTITEQIRAINATTLSFTTSTRADNAALAVGTVINSGSGYQIYGVTNGASGYRVDVRNATSVTVQNVSNMQGSSNLSFPNATGESFNEWIGFGIRSAPQVTLRKQWSGATVGDDATLTLSNGATTLRTFASDAGTASQLDTDTVVTYVNPGNTLTLAETLATSNGSAYTNALACTGASDTTPGDGLTIGSSDGVIVCTYTNTAVPVTPGTNLQPITCPAGSTKYTIADNVGNTNTTRTLIWTNGTTGPNTYTFGTTGITATLQFTSVTNNPTGYPGMYTGLRTGRSNLLSDHGYNQQYNIRGGTTLSVMNISLNVPTVASGVQVWDVDSIYDANNYFSDQIVASTGATLSTTAGSQVTVAGTTATADWAYSLADSCQLDNPRCDVGVAWGSGAASTTRTITYRSGLDTNDSGTHQAIAYNVFEFCVANPTLNIVKDAQPNAAQDFAFTAAPVDTTNPAIPGFSLDDDADATLSNTQTFTTLLPGAYTVTEGANPAGWALDSITCVDPTSNSARSGTTATADINLAVGETVTCTWVNKATTANLSVTKTNNGGTADAASDTLNRGDKTTYTIVATNNGPGAAHNATLRDTPSAGLSACTVKTCTPTPGAGTCPANGTAVATGGTTFTFGTFPAGASITIEVECTVD